MVSPPLEPRDDQTAIDFFITNRDWWGNEAFMRSSAGGTRELRNRVLTESSVSTLGRLASRKDIRSK